MGETLEFIEPCIWRRGNGRYAVRVRTVSGRGGLQVRRTFDTLRAARSFVKEATSARKPKVRPLRRNGRMVDPNEHGVERISRTGSIPGDVLDARERQRQRLSEAPRETVRRGDQEFTLVRLPDAPQPPPTSWKDIYSPIVDHVKSQSKEAA
jgi:hypothetical protein